MPIGTKILKRSIQTLAALGLIAMFGYPLFATWLEAHPETEQALEHAGANVDPKAGAVTRAKQFVSGYSKSDEALADEKREREEDKLIEAEKRKQEQWRQFNSGEDGSY